VQKELQNQKQHAQQQEKELQKQVMLTTRQQQAILLEQEKLKNAEQEKNLQRLANQKMQADLQLAKIKSDENQKQLLIARKEKELQQAQVELKNKEIHSKDLQRNLTVVCVGLLIALSLFIYRNFRNQKKSNDLLSQEKQLSERLLADIQVKNKAITDNINYAQRIQSAILPDLDLIYATLPHSFVLYLPKDIVSGDFYAYAERKDRVLIIAGDCTGHGVSGAFMSMIGNSLLNQIINEKGIEEPATILNMLNAAVIESLKQNVNESHDGMDIAICAFDRDSRLMHYAGANRPLWLVRDKAIHVYKPDKFPIGGLQAARDRTFTNYTIELQPNDAIYIFTDGYADQFGGPQGKKLMTSRFKEMLLDIQDLTMEAQHNHLKTSFENWKGNEEQVDDVLVIGIRV
jgi:serine phosphatase RsbU (regulator of sigma subunit)